MQRPEHWSIKRRVQRAGRLTAGCGGRGGGGQKKATSNLTLGPCAMCNALAGSGWRRWWRRLRAHPKRNTIESKVVSLRPMCSAMAGSQLAAVAEAAAGQTIRPSVRFEHWVIALCAVRWRVRSWRQWWRRHAGRLRGCGWVAASPYATSSSGAAACRCSMLFCGYTVGQQAHTLRGHT